MSKLPSRLFGISLLAITIVATGGGLVFRDDIKVELINRGVLRHYVYDCKDGHKRCEYKLLEYTIINCKPWGENFSNPADCEKTKEGLADISYITDQANYIPLPITKERYRSELIASNLGGFDFEISDTGKFFILAQGGYLLYFDGKDTGSLQLPDQDQEQLFKLIEIQKVGSHAGLALDPNFEENRIFYAFANYRGKAGKRYGEGRVTSKIVSYKLGNENIEEVKILVDNIPGSDWHTGGRLEFGPDGKLYATTGDAENFQKASDPGFIGGKILRINTDGTIPSDNPIPDSFVYSMGHRNPQGIAWDLEDKIMYSSDHGPMRKDEINVIVPGGNYGWGAFACDDLERSYLLESETVFTDAIMPVVCTRSWTIAPSGIEYISDKSSPWYGSLFVASLRGEHIHRYIFKNDQVITDDIFFITSLHLENGKEIESRMRDVEYHDGSLYLLSTQGDLIKITPEKLIDK